MCASSCGNGTMKRTRDVDIAAQHGGAECEGSVSDSKACANLPPCPHDCEWADWDDWMGCSVTCGSGISRRSRARAKYEKHGGSTCFGTEDEEQVCMLDQCPVNCKLGTWTDWTECTKTCGYDGIQQRGRPILQKGSLGGKMCETKDLTAQKSCDISPCPIHCEWGDWGAWSVCTKSCAGGETYRFRSENVTEEHGGSNCVGSADETQVCNPGGCLVDCKWGEWEDWGTCPRTCGGAQRMTERAPVREAEWGGAPCEGPTEKRDTCNDVECPVDCNWSPWSRWSLCSRTCSENGLYGYTNRSRTSIPGKFGGKACDGVALEKEKCNTQGCPVDCQWGNWTEWSECSVTCGGGKLHRAREILVHKANGGDACPGSPAQEADCNDLKCAAPCQWFDWVDWSPWSKSCDVASRKRSREYKVPPSPGGLPCKGEDKETKTMELAACPVDCTLADWNEWGDCSVSCGSGKRFRTRMKSAELNGGKACEERMQEIGDCVNEDFLYGCPTSTESTTSTTTTTTLTNEEGADGWSNESSHWDPYVYKGVQKHSPNQTVETTKKPVESTTSPKPCKPVKPCKKKKRKSSTISPEGDVEDKVSATTSSARNATETGAVIPSTTVPVIVNANTTGWPLDGGWTMPPTTSTLPEVIQILNDSTKPDHEVTIDEVSHLLDSLPNPSPQLKSIMRKVTSTTTSTTRVPTPKPSPIKSTRLTATVSGDLTLEVSDAEAFLQIPDVETYCAHVMGDIAKVNASLVHTKVTLIKGAKSLLELGQEPTTTPTTTFSPDPNVNVAYAIKVFDQSDYQGAADEIANWISAQDMGTVNFDFHDPNLTWQYHLDKLDVRASTLSVEVTRYDSKPIMHVPKATRSSTTTQTANVTNAATPGKAATSTATTSTVTNTTTTTTISTTTITTTYTGTTSTDTGTTSTVTGTSTTTTITSTETVSSTTGSSTTVTETNTSTTTTITSTETVSSTTGSSTTVTETNTSTTVTETETGTSSTVTGSSTTVTGSSTTNTITDTETGTTSTFTGSTTTMAEHVTSSLSPTSNSTSGSRPVDVELVKAIHRALDVQNDTNSSNGTLTENDGEATSELAPGNGPFVPPTFGEYQDGPAEFYGGLLQRSEVGKAKSASMLQTENDDGDANSSPPSPPPPSGLWRLLGW